MPSKKLYSVFLVQTNVVLLTIILAAAWACPLEMHLAVKVSSVSLTIGSAVLCPWMWHSLYCAVLYFAVYWTDSDVLSVAIEVCSKNESSAI